MAYYRFLKETLQSLMMNWLEGASKSKKRRRRVLEASLSLLFLHVHRLEELSVTLREADFVDEELHRLHSAHRVQEPSEDPHL